MQLTVTNSPFSKEQSENLNQILPSLSVEQRIWLSGYLSATQNLEVLQNGGTTPVQIKETLTSSQNQSKTREITILFGSETGNAQSLAEEMENKLEERQFKVKASVMDDFKPKELKKVEDLFIITATHGEGDPPENAVSFYEFLHSRKAPKLNGVRFSVLSLGDQSYEFFCQSGKDFDKRLEELGGERIHDRVDCDLDFDEPAGEWMEGVFNKLAESGENQAKLASSEAAGSIATEQPVYSRTNPYMAEVLENIKLNGRGSIKETRHIELSLEGSNLQFEPGDSLGIYPLNDTSLVDKIIDKLNWNPDETVPVNKQGEIRSIREALISHFEITRLTKPLVSKIAEIFRNDGLKHFIDNEDALKKYMDGRDLLDLIHDFPPNELQPSDLVQVLRKIPAREYSIASSYQANPDEVHLTVGAVRYHAHGRDRNGVCSVQLAERSKPGELVPVYVHRNPNFKFPFDEDTPVILIGPGTGVAPFRSFLEEREELEIKGKTWLFFGEQHFTTDFLYQVDWQNWLKEGVLTRMDVAFSRDSKEKVYVQHRILEKSKDFYQWLKEGARVYVCGDEKHMAKDVHSSLLTVLKEEGNMSQEEAENYLNQMKKEKRYQRDVY
ncbi:assimilatory sulfite reductase (NADPH) flavoprotein subunit [Oceanobacillus senegalensis]|uniref:assimilatory sulfite reductase (NADPH) flavoprotein subunit n=1 Tax=Oceanobacillus senegalensis TaxID=1936063 RepID=UPI000A30F7D6|nr:assimilatory sulfite reductase (NADPH) flavoprotein subunit [Oceanobacillus senegalensis]